MWRREDDLIEAERKLVYEHERSVGVTGVIIMLLIGFAGLVAYTH